jgi:uncharacterized membrane protein YhaH (DUF805 family)
MRWILGLLSLKGRASRVDYWRFQVVAGLVLGVAIAATIGVAEAGGPGVIPFLFIIPIFLAAIATSVRRLHDRNYSTRSALALLGGPFALAVVAAGLREQQGPLQVASLLVSLAGLILGFWAAIEIYLLRGTRGPNRFGPESVSRSRRVKPRPVRP